MGEFPETTTELGHPGVRCEGIVSSRHVRMDSYQTTSPWAIPALQECTNAAVLDRWIDNVFGAETVADVLA